MFLFTIIYIEKLLMKIFKMYLLHNSYNKWIYTNLIYHEI